MASTLKVLLAEVKRIQEGHFTACPISASFASWTHMCTNVKETTSYERADGKTWQCEARFDIRGETPRVLKGKGKDVTKKYAYENACGDIMTKIPRVQNDVPENKPPEGEEKHTETAPAGTTVMMNDDDDAVVVTNKEISNIQRMMSSTEPLVDFSSNSVVNRWFPMDQFSITASDTYLDEPIKVYNIPEFLYGAYANADKCGNGKQINLLPLRGFIYGHLELEFKMMVTAAPFQTGRLMLSVLPIPMGLKTTERIMNMFYTLKTQEETDVFNKSYASIVNSYTGVSVSTARPNVILDIADSTTGTIDTKFLFNRPFVRILDGLSADVNPGVRGALIYALLIHSVTPIRIGPDQPNQVQVKMYYRFKEMKLTGLTSQHNLLPETQMDLLPLIGGGLDLINGVERQLTRAGVRTNNRDKPNSVFKVETVIPRPRLHFQNGKGIGDATIMAVDVTTLSTHFENTTDPSDWLTYAQLPGLYQRVKIKTTAAANEEVFQVIAAPLADPNEVVTNFTTGTVNHAVYIPPVDIAAGHFMFYSGTIVYRFDFIKSKFHRLTLLFSISYGKNEGLGDSVYEKIVEIQDRKSVEVRIPYIYDTMVRRTGTACYHETLPNADSWGPDILPMHSNTKLTVRIVNPLTEISAVSNVIDMVVYKYAGQDFHLYSPVQSITELYPQLDLTEVNSGFPWFKAPIQETDVKGALDNFNYYPIIERDNTNLTEDKTALKHAAPKARVQIEEDEFAVGPMIPARLNTDVVATRYKDLLRRPILVATIPMTKTQRVNLPVLPVSRDMVYFYKNAGIAWSHQAHITTQFAMWRGDIEITLVVTGAPQAIVNVTYFPPDGILRPLKVNKQILRYFGEENRSHDVGYSMEGGTITPASSGCMTTLLIPSVNPTEKFNIPYNSPYSYLYLNRVANTGALNSFRDITSTTNGTLVVESTEDITMQIFYNVGDTFEMAGFLAHPPIMTTIRHAHPDAIRLIKDIPLQPQPVTDFMLSELGISSQPTVQMEGAIDKLLTWAPLAAAATSFICPIEYQLACGVVAVATGASKFARTCTGVQQKITGLSNNLNNFVTTQSDDIVEQMVETVLPGRVAKGTVDAVYQIGSEVVHCCWAKDWKGIALGIFNILKTLKLATKKLIASAIKTVVDWFKPQSETQGEFDVVSFFNMVLTLACTAIYTTMFATTPAMEYIRGKASSLMKMREYFKGLSIVGGGVAFLTRFIKACITFAEGLMKEKDPQARTLSEFVGKDEYLESFINEAHFYLDDRNSRHGFGHPTTKARFWLCALNAYQISGMLHRLTNFQPSMRPLLDLCTKVIKKTNENIQQFEKHIVKYIPYLVHITGPPRIGKSFVSDKLVAIMAKNTGHTGGMVPAYTFPVNAKYCNLYNGEQFVKLDDFFALRSSDARESEAAFIMESKSPITQNVSKPELNAKKDIFNLRGIVVASNNPYPDYTGVLSTPTACDQRFDELWECRDNGKVKNETFEHLEFARLPIKRPDGTVNVQKEWISAAVFFEGLRVRHIAYHKAQLETLRKRIELSASTLNDAAMMREYLVDPLTFFYDATETIQSNELLAETLPSATVMPLEDQVADLINQFTKMKAFKSNNGWTIKKPEIEELGSEEEIEVQAEGSSSWIESVFRLCQKREVCSRCRLPMAKWAFVWTCEKKCTYCPSCQILSRSCKHLEVLKPSVSRPVRCLYWIWYYSAKVCTTTLAYILDHPVQFMCLTGYGLIRLCRLISDIKYVTGNMQVIQALTGSCNLKWALDNKPTIEMGKRLLINIQGSRVQDEDSDSEYELDTPKLPPLSKTVDANSFAPICSMAGISNPLESEPVVSLYPKVNVVNPDANQKFEPIVPTEKTVEAYLRDNTLQLQTCAHMALYKVWIDLGIKLEDGIRDMTYSCVKDKRTFKYTINGLDYVIPDGQCFKTTCLGRLGGHKCSFADVPIATRFYRTFLDTHKEVIRTSLRQKMETITFNTPRIYWSEVLRSYDSELMIAVRQLTQKGWLLTLYNVVKDNYMYILAGIAALYGLYRVMKNTEIFTKVLGVLGIGSVPLSQAIFHDSGEQRTSRIRGAKRTRAAVTQSQIEFYNNISVKIVKNYILMGAGGKRLIGLGLCDDVVMLPKHYYNILKVPQEVIVRFSPRAVHENTKLDSRNFEFIAGDDDDFMLVRLGKKAWFADIRKFFMCDKEYDEMGDDSLEFAYVQRDGCDVEFKNVNLLNTLDQHIAIDSNSQNYFSYRVLEYDFEEAGACGNVVLRENSVRPICAMHISGVRGARRGQGLVVTQEMIASMLQGQKLRNFAPVQVESEECTHDFGVDVNFEYLGSVTKQPYMPEKTALSHSLIAEIISKEDIVAPAILSAKDPRYEHPFSPMHYGVAKHGKPVDSFWKEDVLACRNFWTEMLLYRTKPVPGVSVKIYDVKEAIIGVPSVSDFFDPLPSDTSVGYPLTLTGKTKKSDWIEYVRNDQGQAIDAIIDSTVLNDLNRFHAMREAGDLPPEVFQDELKDEKRKIAKLMAPGGTRVFSMSPLTASIAHRQYFMDYTNALHYSLIDNWHAIAINPDSMHWTQLANKLLKISNNCFTIDFTNFGPGLDIEVAAGFGHAANEWYKKHGVDGSKHRTLLVDGLLNSVHIAMGNLYRTRAGSPSGGTETGEINSWTHLNYITLVWKLLHRIQSKQLTWHEERKLAVVISQLEEDLKPLSFTFEDFIANVSGVVYGDDGLFSVSNKYKDVFNAKTISLILSCYGIAATDSSKQATVVPYTTIFEAEFLKRKFRFERSTKRWYAPIAETTIIECARWIREKKARKVATRENAGASLLLAFGHGREYFDKWKQRVNSALVAVNILPITWTWQEIENMAFPTTQARTLTYFNMNLYLECKNHIKYIGTSFE